MCVYTHAHTSYTMGSDQQIREQSCYRSGVACNDIVGVTMF